MKKTVTAILLICVILGGYASDNRGCKNVCASDGGVLDLYARAAVLMDADTGRILFAKNGRTELPMASTTKIMTCILALENGNLSDKVAVSKKAAMQPKVHLGVIAGENYYLNDLLYSLMLESHNDSAVAVAEHIGGTMKGFSGMMNDKASELNCKGTYFITPNGLDAKDERGIHHTTAEDLAKIMKYCIMDSLKKDEFIKITGTAQYSFSDCEGKRNFTVYNHNAFLKMMKGALSGKTGFTADAGYCYVGALKDESRTFIAALLACGWPNNKSYKWADTKKLMEYGLEKFHYKKVWKKLEEQKIRVENSIDPENIFNKDRIIPVEIKSPDEEWSLLLCDEDKIRISGKIKKALTAPADKQTVGYIQYFLNGQPIRRFELVTTSGVLKRTFVWSVKTAAGLFIGADKINNK